jgi:hypothetical protein
MRQISNSPSSPKASEGELGSITTKFGDLIAALNEGIKPEEDDLVPQIVFHLIKTGRMKFHESLRA